MILRLTKKTPDASSKEFYQKIAYIARYLIYATDFTAICKRRKKRACLFKAKPAWDHLFSVRVVERRLKIKPCTELEFPVEA